MLRGKKTRVPPKPPPKPPKDDPAPPLRLILDGRASFEAEIKAHRLLWRHLNKDQRERWDRDWGFDVRGKSGIWYTIFHSPYNLSCHVITETYFYCAYSLDLVIDPFSAYPGASHSSVHLPIADDALAKKLLIESNEKKFLSIAVPSMISGYRGEMRERLNSQLKRRKKE